MRIFSLKLIMIYTSFQWEILFSNTDRISPSPLSNFLDSVGLSNTSLVFQYFFFLLVCTPMSKNAVSHATSEQCSQMAIAEWRERAGMWSSKPDNPTKGTYPYRNRQIKRPSGRKPTSISKMEILLGQEQGPLYFGRTSG